MSPRGSSLTVVCRSNLRTNLKKGEGVGPVRPRTRFCIPGLEAPSPAHQPPRPAVSPARAGPAPARAGFFGGETPLSEVWRVTWHAGDVCGAARDPAHACVCPRSGHRASGSLDHVMKRLAPCLRAVFLVARETIPRFGAWSCQRTPHPTPHPQDKHGSPTFRPAAPRRGSLLLSPYDGFTQKRNVHFLSFSLLFSFFLGGRCCLFPTPRTTERGDLSPGQPRGRVGVQTRCGGPGRRRPPSPGSCRRPEGSEPSPTRTRGV